MSTHNNRILLKKSSEKTSLDILDMTFRKNAV